MVTNLCYFVDSISKGMEERAQIEGIYINTQKVFDKVDHNILVRKLVNFGFSTSSKDLIKKLPYVNPILKF